MFNLSPLKPAREGAFIVISWANWRPEILGYEVWATRPDGSSDIVSTVIQSPAVFTVSVDEATPMRFTVRARAGERTISFDKSPSVAALIPAPAAGVLGPNSVGETELIHDGPNRIVIVSADILSLVANKISAGTLDAGMINVINLSADSINGGTINGFLVNVLNLNAGNLVAGTVDAARLRLEGNVYIITSPPASSLGINGNTAISVLSGRVWDKMGGVWVERDVTLPTITGLIARITGLFLGRLESGEFHAWDLSVSWDAIPTQYLVEIDVGAAPTTLAGNDSTWDDVSGVYAGELGFKFLKLTAPLSPAVAVRTRLVGPLGHRGPWTYAYISFSGPPLVAIAPEDASIGTDAGEQATLYCWVANAVSAILNPGAHIIALDAMRNAYVGVQLSLTSGRSIFTLSATNGDGTAETSATIQVFARDPDVPTPPPVDPPTPASISRFDADDTSIVEGDDVTLTWVTEDADTVTLGVVGEVASSVAASGSMVVSPDETTTYRLRATGGGSTRTRDVTITVSDAVDPPESPIAVLNANTLEVSPGSSVVLTWATEHATAASIDNEVGDVSPIAGGSVTVNPTETTTYELTATGDGGSATDSVTIVVTEPDPMMPAPVIIRFEGDPSSITTGQSSFLEWEVENATSLRINQGIGSVAPVDIGAEGVSPSSTRTYTLTATGPGGTRTATATVTVSDPPPSCPDPPSIDSFVAADTSIFLGEDVDLDWSTSNTNDVSINQGIGSVGNDSDVSHTPSSVGTITYRITASKPDCPDATRTVSVVVSARPPSPTITSFSVNPTSLENQDSATFTWESENGATAAISGIGAVPLNGSRTITIGGSPGDIQNFSLTIFGPAGALPRTAVRTVSITIEEPSEPPPAPNILYFRTVSRNYDIIEGESETLEWDSENGVSASLNQGIGNVPTSGSFTVSPSSSTHYSLRITGAEGADPRSITGGVQINVTQQPVIDSFTVTIVSQTPLVTEVRLDWATSDATSVSITGITNSALDGSETLTITASTSWTLTASGPTGTTPSTRTVSVTL